MHNGPRPVSSFRAIRHPGWKSALFGCRDGWARVGKGKRRIRGREAGCAAVAAGRLVDRLLNRCWVWGSWAGWPTADRGREVWSDPASRLFCGWRSGGRTRREPLFRDLVHAGLPAGAGGAESVQGGGLNWLNDVVGANSFARNPFIMRMNSHLPHGRRIWINQSRPHFLHTGFNESH